MTMHDDDLDQLLRPWMQRHAPDAPNEFVLRILGEIETMSEHAPTRGWLSRFTTWPASAWGTAAAALAIVAIAVGILFVNLTGTPAPANRPTPTPNASAAALDPTALADQLITAWNDGDGHKVVSMYGPSANPLVRFMINSSEFTTELITVADVESYATSWHSNGSVMTRTGDVLTQSPFAAFPATWTTSDGSFDGVVVVRISPTGLITEQYVIGATSSAGVTQAAAQNLWTSWREATSASDGAAAGELLAPSANGWVIRDGVVGNNVASRANFVDAINSGTGGGSPTRTVEVQGPYIVGAIASTCSCDPGALENGFEVLEVNADGLIAHIWRMDTKTYPSGSPSPTGSGG